MEYNYNQWKLGVRTLRAWYIDVFREIVPLIMGVDVGYYGVIKLKLRFILIWSLLAKFKVNHGIFSFVHCICLYQITLHYCLSALSYFFVHVFILVENSTNDKIKGLFQSLEYGPAPESPAVVNAWLDDHGRSFGHFINGQWMKPPGRKTYDTYNPVNGEKIATTIQGLIMLIFSQSSLLVSWLFQQSSFFSY